MLILFPHNSVGLGGGGGALPAKHNRIQLLLAAPQLPLRFLSLLLYLEGGMLKEMLAFPIFSPKDFLLTEKINK